MRTIISGTYMFDLQNTNKSQSMPQRPGDGRKSCWTHWQDSEWWDKMHGWLFLYTISSLFTSPHLSQQCLPFLSVSYIIHLLGKPETMCGTCFETTLFQLTHCMAMERPCSVWVFHPPYGPEWIRPACLSSPSFLTLHIPYFLWPKCLVPERIHIVA